MTFVSFVLTVIILASCAGVLVFKNPIHSALALVANLVAVAGVFATLNAHFLAVAQIVVYAGAIMVLVVFVLMLLSSKEEHVDKNRIYYLVFGGIVAAVFALGLFSRLKVFSGADVSKSLSGTVLVMGKLLYTGYVFPFEAASIVILAAIAGAILLAKRKI